MTVERIKDFLDDLARISLRHGVMIEDWEIEGAGSAMLIPMRSDLEGYRADVDGDGGVWLASYDWKTALHDDEIRSLDLTKLSAHERIHIHGARTPDLEQLIQDAFMAGVEATGEGWNGEHPMTKESSEDFHGQAYDYASATVRDMGGQRPRDTEALLGEAVRHLRAWVAWCDGPADPHPLDSLREAKAFLERLDAEGGQTYPATPDVTYVSISDDTGLMDDDVLDLLYGVGGQS